MNKIVVLVIAIGLAFVVPQVYGKSPKPVEIVDQPIRVIIESEDSDAGISVYKEGTCSITTSDPTSCRILFYNVPTGETFVATHLFVDVDENSNIVACLMEDDTTKACLPSSQWAGPMPVSISFAGESEVKVQLTYQIGTGGCDNGGCPENYRITLMGNLM